MCNQTVSLVAAEMERQGITTVVLQLLRLAAERVGPPRALLVPFRHGFPLGQSGDAALQHRIIEAAFTLMELPGRSPPVFVEFSAAEPTLPSAR
jgi:hypothetical protein